jgi:hypothetical protein
MRKLHRVLLLLAVLAAVVFASHAVFAQSGGGYDLTWNTIDSGGVIFSTGGGFSLGGTIGQPDASAALGGGGFSLVGGFWSGIPPYRMYLPLILKS